MLNWSKVGDNMRKRAIAPGKRSSAIIMIINTDNERAIEKVVFSLANDPLFFQIMNMRLFWIKEEKQDALLQEK